jgi:hypothetical protein
MQVDLKLGLRCSGLQPSNCRGLLQYYAREPTPLAKCNLSHMRRLKHVEPLQLFLSKLWRGKTTGDARWQLPVLIGGFNIPTLFKEVCQSGSSSKMGWAEYYNIIQYITCWRKPPAKHVSFGGILIKYNESTRFPNQRSVPASGPPKQCRTMVEVLSIFAKSGGVHGIDCHCFKI